VHRSNDLCTVTLGSLFTPVTHLQCWRRDLPRDHADADCWYLSVSFMTQ